ncbi:MAG: hypothetical protein DMF76_21305 [Acidobacteria bacterium]|nr:MAG: hypothetical protein DMF76_21305 [Acidobacteriota bacterium]
MDLPYNLDGISTDANRADGDFDGKKQTLAGELLPSELALNGVRFKLGSGAPGALNVLVPKGETVALPPGAYNRVYILAAAVGGDAPATIGGQNLIIREWQGPVGQWDSRLKVLDCRRDRSGSGREIRSGNRRRQRHGSNSSWLRQARRDRLGPHTPPQSQRQPAIRRELHFFLRDRFTRGGSRSTAAK